ncbi:MAG: class I SAM-dependent methyltransferase [Rhodocyclaceae bacterium]|nr:class I SAM-dependent methyltransferase [Rhodocyclaceae bacterium]
MKPQMKEISRCEVCRSKDLSLVLDLNHHPMCDDLVPVGDSRVCVEYPIQILYCEHCRTAHQKYQVPKQDLFPKTYHYRSRFTADVLNGMKGLVERCESRFGSLHGKKVLDVGCNDGSLLGFFRDKGAATIGVEPTGACADAREQRHITYNDFLVPDLANKIADEQGLPDFIVFTNVFAHIEDLTGVLASLRRLMSQDTVIVIENHYLGAVLDGNQFDTFYHEHPRTYSYTSFVHIARLLGVAVSEVEFPARYGGNIRVFLGPANARAQEETDEIRAVLNREAAFPERFRIMQRSVELWRTRKKAEIEDLVRQHGRLAAKAFPGRAAILIKLLGLDADLISVVYEKPGSMKVGHYLPGTHIPIVSDDELFASGDLSKPLLNLAWHISGEIRSYLTKRGYTGPIIDIVSQEDFV